MVTATTKNPYLLFGAEPKDWKNHGNVKDWEQHKKDVQSQNEKWWEVHNGGTDYPHVMETPISVEGSDFPLGQGNRYGPFIYCPLPISGVVRWGFRRADGYAAFRLDVENDTLPTGGRIAGQNAAIARMDGKVKPAAKVIQSAPAEEDPFAALGGTPAEEDPFAALGGTPAAEPDPFADFAPAEAPAPAEDDPFAALDISGPASEAAPEPAAAAPASEEPEVDEWGEVISKPATDPFEGLI